MYLISELCFSQPAGCAKQDLPEILGETGRKRKNRAEKKASYDVLGYMLAKQLCVGEKGRQLGTVTSNLLSHPALILGMHLC